MNIHRIARTMVLALLLVTTVAVLIDTEPAEATLYTVTKTNDTNDGSCNFDCSLREAVVAANANAGADTIRMAADTYALSIGGTGEDAAATGDLDITDTLTFQAEEGTIFDGSGVDRVIHVVAPAMVDITGVTIRNGHEFQGGGIYNSGTLTLTGSTVNGNVADNWGGGIYNSITGSVNLDGGDISGNFANGAGGIFNDGTLTIYGSTISGNAVTSDAGGIFNGSGYLALSDSTISGNWAENLGGGILNLSSAVITGSTLAGNTSLTGGGIASGGTLVITTSTINGNNGGYDGGGIFSDWILTVTDSTISGNAAANGGGVTAGGTATITSSTVSNNWNTGIYDAGATTVKNTIVANHPGANCNASVISAGFNLSSDGTCVTGGAGNIAFANPLLGPLAFNGGPTPTHALLEGSAASDAGSIPCPTAADQRGITRAQGFRCDIGAYEAPDSDSDGASDPRDNDDDNDARLDSTDACPLVAEDVDGWQDGDGCPEPDNDSDGVCDAGQSALSCTGSDSGKMVWDPAGTLPAPTLDCRNTPEDLDAFKDGDGCPEPDNDNDGFPDATDACPGTNSRAGADGMLGSPQDLNHNGVRDGAEAALTTDDVMPALVWEDSDGVLDTDGCHDSPGDDFDGDGLTDNDEVFTHLTDAGNPDTDADTVIDGTDNCPNWANAAQNVPAWAIPALDSDCDGFNKTREQHVGTDPTKHCNNTAAANDEPVDFWPTDFNDSRLTTLADVVLMGPAYNKLLGQAGYNQRFDLNASNGVTLADVVLMGPFYNKSCG